VGKLIYHKEDNILGIVRMALEKSAIQIYHYEVYCIDDQADAYSTRAIKEMIKDLEELLNDEPDRI
jgi:hypothetical protein